MPSSTRRKYVEINGERLPVAEWARRHSLDPNTLISRLIWGWPIEFALETPEDGTYTGPRFSRPRKLSDKYMYPDATEVTPRKSVAEEQPRAPTPLDNLLPVNVGLNQINTTDGLLDELRNIYRQREWLNKRESEIMERIGRNVVEELLDPSDL